MCACVRVCKQASEWTFVYVYNIVCVKYLKLCMHLVQLLEALMESAALVVLLATFSCCS